MNDDQSFSKPTQGRSSTDESLANTFVQPYKTTPTFSPLVRVLEIKTQNGEVTLIGFVFARRKSQSRSCC